jgi:hypothetical protein
VLIPAWNAGPSIRQAIESVLAAESGDLEIVVIDDASTDDTAAVVEALAASDARVRLIRSDRNEGVSNARNLGLEAARGTWLTFLDADDVLLPGGLDRLLAATEREAPLAVIGQRVWTDGRTRWRSPTYDIPDIRRAGRKSLATNPGLLYYASATGKLFHESTVKALRFEGRVLGDQPWTVRALLRAGDRIEVIGDDVYEWRRPAAPSASTITAAKRSSARSAAEAAGVAVGALAAVQAEAEAQLADPASRRIVTDGYFERLVRADLAGPVARALARGDDGADALFDAVLAFLDAAPAPVVERSAGAVADALVLEPLDYWVGARPAARPAFVAFLRRLTTGHPAVRERLGRVGLAGRALDALAHAPSGRTTPWVNALLTLRWPVALLRRWRRPGRRPIPAAGR